MEDEAARILPLVAVAVKWVLLIFREGGALRICNRCCGGFLETEVVVATDVVITCWAAVGGRLVDLFWRATTDGVLVETISCRVTTLPELRASAELTEVVVALMVEAALASCTMLTICVRSVSDGVKLSGSVSEARMLIESAAGFASFEGPIDASAKLRALRNWSIVIIGWILSSEDLSTGSSWFLAEIIEAYTRSIYHHHGEG